MSNPEPERAVEEADDRYSRVDADDVVEDTKQLFEQHHEGPPDDANPEAFGLIDPAKEDPSP
jgi:hypothetical protein